MVSIDDDDKQSGSGYYSGSGRQSIRWILFPDKVRHLLGEGGLTRSSDNDGSSSFIRGGKVSVSGAEQRESAIALQTERSAELVSG